MLEGNLELLEMLKGTSLIYRNSLLYRSSLLYSNRELTSFFDSPRGMQTLLREWSRAKFLQLCLGGLVCPFYR
jgi:hypothetical protein